MFREMFPVADTDPVVDRDRIEVDKAVYNTKKQKTGPYSAAVYEPYINIQINNALAINQTSASELTVTIADALTARLNDKKYSIKDPIRGYGSLYYSMKEEKKFKTVYLTTKSVGFKGWEWDKYPNKEQNARGWPIGISIYTATLASSSQGFSIATQTHLAVERNDKNTMDWSTAHKNFAQAWPVSPPVLIPDETETRHIILLTHRAESNRYYIFGRAPLAVNFDSDCVIIFPAGTTFGGTDLSPAVATPGHIVCALLRQIGEKLNDDKIRVLQRGQTISDVEATPIKQTERKGLSAFFKGYVTDLLFKWATVTEDKCNGFDVLDLCT